MRRAGLVRILKKYPTQPAELAATETSSILWRREGMCLRAFSIGCLVVVAIGASLLAADGPVARAPIVIGADSGFTAENGVRAGTGTEEDPFVISAWTIDASGSTYCILIENVSRAFRIEHCVLTGAAGVAVKLASLQEPGRVAESCIASCPFGVQIDDSAGCSIERCTFDDIDWAAIYLSGGSGHTISGCLFVEATPGILASALSTNHRFLDNVFLPGCRAAIRMDAQCGGNMIARNDFHQGACYSASYNRWDDASGQGNYWSRYHWPDRDGDGVGDTPYPILGDSRETNRFPAMSPFHPEALEARDRCPVPT
jgi:hypothetical protein